tara:strand:- start:16971 stop:18011 length:1041 start_codon:yes stop_codon:yes gene_type:complete
MRDNAWENTLIDINSSIEKAINLLDKNGKRILIVTKNDKYFLGTISDGDIRRGLITGFQLNSNIKEVINSDSIKVSPNSDHSLILKLMNDNEVEQIPEVNNKGICTGLFLKSLTTQKKLISSNLLIMAGGEGRRLLPRTKEIPKPLLKVKGKPIIEHIIESAKKNGVNDIIVSLNYLGKKIEDYLKDGKKFGVNITYLKESKKLGTAGCLSLIEKLPEEPLLVVNGDLITNVDLNQILNFHLDSKSAATMGVRMHESQNPFGVVKLSGTDIVGFEEKPIYTSYVNAGIYVINPDCIKYLPFSEPYDMPNFFDLISSKNKKTSAFMIHESWIDVGRENDFLSANNTL